MPGLPGFGVDEVMACACCRERGAVLARLPAGVSFKPGSSGAAVLAGTPAARSGGQYKLTVTAVNGVFPAASQAFTLTVRQAPSIVSPSRAVFHSGRRRFSVISRGFPAPHLRETGRLPHHFTFRVHSNGTATLTGDPVASQVGKRYVIKITASNGVGRAVTQSLTIVIRAR
jgi:large repetitive protein